MILTDEEAEILKTKLFNEHTKEELESLANITTDEINEYISLRKRTRNFSPLSGDFNALYYTVYPLLNTLDDICKSDDDICKSCVIKKTLKFLFKTKKEGK